MALYQRSVPDAPSPAFDAPASEAEAEGEVRRPAAEVQLDRRGIRRRAGPFASAFCQRTSPPTDELPTGPRTPPRIVGPGRGAVGDVARREDRAVDVDELADLAVAPADRDQPAADVGLDAAAAERQEAAVNVTGICRSLRSCAISDPSACVTFAYTLGTVR